MSKIKHKYTILVEIFCVYMNIITNEQITCGSNMSVERKMEIKKKLGIMVVIPSLLTLILFYITALKIISTIDISIIILYRLLYYIDKNRAQNNILPKAQKFLVTALRCEYLNMNR